FARSRAWARPRPPPAPVTIATLSLKEMAMGFLAVRFRQDGVGTLCGSRRRPNCCRNLAAAGRSAYFAHKPAHHTQTTTSNRGSSHQIRLENGMPRMMVSGGG